MEGSIKPLLPFKTFGAVEGCPIHLFVVGMRLLTYPIETRAWKAAISSKASIRESKLQGMLWPFSITAIVARRFNGAARRAGTRRASIDMTEHHYWLIATPLKAATPTEGEVATQVKSP